MAVPASTLRGLVEAAERLEEYGRLQPRIARCAVHPPGWRADPTAVRRLAQDLRDLARALAAREEDASLARGRAAS